MEAPGLWVESQLQAYTTATATLDLSHIYNLLHRVQPHRILSLSKTRDWTYILTVLNQLSHSGNPEMCFWCHHAYGGQRRSSFPGWIL